LVFIAQIEARSKTIECQIGRGLTRFVRFGEEKLSCISQE